MSLDASRLDLRRVDLNLLVAFDALMAERSVTAAAERLSVGQSSMSSTLARLRKLLDDPIMVREGRNMVVTPVAESLVQPVRETLNTIQAMLSHRGHFDPTLDSRTFTVMTSDYSALVALQPLLAVLPQEAPNIQLRIQPVGSTFPDALARNQIDMLIAPREIFPDSHLHCHEPLYTDRYLVAVDIDNPDVGEQITMEQFSSMPYLATHYELAPSLAEMQLDLLGVPRRVEGTASFGLAPFLIRDTRLVSMVPEIFGKRIAAAAGIRLLDPPMKMPTVTETLVWTNRVDGDPGHRWLRRRLHQLAEAF